MAVSADGHVKPTNVQQVADPPGPHEAKRQHESSWLQNTNNPLKGKGHKQETSEFLNKQNRNPDHIICLFKGDRNTGEWI